MIDCTEAFGSERNLNHEPICFYRGDFAPLKQLAIPASDIGFIHGATISEQVRTFNSQPFLLDKHIERWNKGLQTLNLSAPCDDSTILKVVQRLVEHNATLLPQKTEQGVCFFSTPGQSDFGWGDAQMTETTFSAYTYPLPTKKHGEHYRSGVQLVTTSICDVPAECWPQSIKVRSRLHYYLAQLQARQLSFEAHPILLDQQGFVSDSAIASIVGWTQSEGIIVRPVDNRYASVSVDYLTRLAGQLNIPVVERTFTLGELTSFEEAFLVSTPWCIYPVAQIDHIPTNGRACGYPKFTQLVQAWESAVDCAIL